MVSRWCPPPENWVLDAALFSDDRRMGCGVIIRDHKGKFLLSCSEGMAGLPTPEMAETIAARRVLSIARSYGFPRVILVSDYLSMIQRISSPARDRSYLGSVVCDIKSLKTDFESCLFRFSSRKTNVVAHKLARFAEPLVCNISVSVIPEFIREELCNDVI
jgi:hypothetical protein